MIRPDWLGMDKGISRGWLYRLRRQFVMVNHYEDQRETLESQRELVEYGGAFANPTLYNKLKFADRQRAEGVVEGDHSVGNRETFLKISEELKAKAASQSKVGDISFAPVDQSENK